MSTTSEPNLSAPGLLLVLVEPGPAIPEAEFNDWADNEHVPLRMAIPTFLSCTRWVAADDRKPTQLALYNVSALSALYEPPYTTLGQTRSEREKALAPRIALFDRRIYEQLGVPLQSTEKRQGRFVRAVAMDVPPEHQEEVNKWYEEEHAPMLAKVPSWVRSTHYVLREGGVSGTDESLKPARATPKYLAVHEYMDAGAVGTEEYRAAVSTPWTKRVAGYAEAFDGRSFELLRRWERE
ncbi:hypothetical protein L226DRAFT_533811 [Lentinus tigrinus ALCF2SS1-7]|uniref:EthD domain-containing protein n=1 Tax=Lentinus tigrinus ALCF2SS1-6 TaxID=1328759 RepID=A0A5C2S9K6_9APHY|nr:hypothetical protein L227DRAFT_575104 [Lentinus tigrinus ALCF2SS1-6]RPD75734.1 hypothetical protein L226DRAFT_533811 [Lentinus tigrinus ALCF2SS1-7]